MGLSVVMRFAAGADELDVCAREGYGVSVPVCAFRVCPLSIGLPIIATSTLRAMGSF